MPPRIPEGRAWQVIGMWRAGRKQANIAHHLRMSQGTISKLIQRYRTHQHVRPGVSTGRPRKTTARDDRLLYQLCRRSRTKSASTLRDEWHRLINSRVSRPTVNSRLLSRGLRARRPAKKPLMTRDRKQRRLEWVQQHQNFQLRHWRHVLFSDESRILLHRVDGRLRVRREVGQRFQEDCVMGTIAHGGGSVHVWGAIHYGGRTNLVVLVENVNADSYRRVLETHMVPYARAHFGRNFLFQHDNAPAHRARRLQGYLEEEEIDQLPWPAYSPDLNPIEHCWDELGRAVRKRDVQPTTLAELRVALTQEWNNLSQRYINKLIESVPRRVRAVLQARGGYTRY